MVLDTCTNFLHKNILIKSPSFKGKIRFINEPMVIHHNRFLLVGLYDVGIRYCHLMDLINCPNVNTTEPIIKRD